MTAAQAFLSVTIIAVVTFFTRATPFFLFPNNRPVPQYIKYLGGVLPFAVIGMLVVYCLKSVSMTAAPYGLPEGIAIIFIVIVHKLKHNLLLSILGGTALYMLLIQTIFAAG